MELFAYAPLNPLTQREEDGLWESLTRTFDMLNGRGCTRIIGSPTFYLPTDKAAQFPDNTLVIVDEAQYNLPIIGKIMKEGLRPLTREEKIRLISDVEIYFKLRYEVLSRNSTTGFFGGHNLSISAYGYDRDRLVSVLDGIRDRTRRNTVAVMDVGGQAGSALYTARAIDPRIETWNLTIWQEPVSWPVDHTLVCPMERMPADLYERIDLIISNASFWYSIYPDHGLINCLKALSVGGEMDIDFNCVNTKADRADVGRRIFLAIVAMKDLAAKGFIDFEFECPGATFEQAQIEPGRCIHSLYYRIKARKLQSLGDFCYRFDAGPNTA